MFANLSFNYIDITLLVLWTIAIITGVVKGFIKQLFGLAALILACYSAYKFSLLGAQKLTLWFGWREQVGRIISFIVLFAVVLLLVSLLGRLLDRIVRFAFLGWVNRLLGGIFGWLKGTVLLAILLYFLKLVHNLVPFLPTEVMRKSFCFAIVEKVAALLLPYLSFLGQ